MPGQNTIILVPPDRKDIGDMAGVLVQQINRSSGEFIVSKATGKPYKHLAPPATGRPDRNFSLTDGTTGGIGGYEVAGVVSFQVAGSH